MRRTVFVIILLYPLFNIYSQDVTVKSDVEEKTILIGDQVHLKYIIEKKAGIKVDFPVKREKLSDQIEIIDSVKIDTAKLQDNAMSISLDYLITAFDTGRFSIPQYPFYIYRGSNVDTLFAGELSLQVNGVAIDSTKTVRDIKPIEKLTFPWRKFILITGISLVGLILILLIIYYTLIKNRKKGILGHDRLMEPPHITALRELDKLKTQKIWQKGDIKEYYSRLTFIIRNYMEHRFHILALEQTSNEILKEFKKVNIYGPGIVEILDGLLNLADLVKFAKNNPLPDENVTHLENAYAFVKTTMQKEEELTNTTEKDKIK